VAHRYLHGTGDSSHRTMSIAVYCGYDRGVTGVEPFDESSRPRGEREAARSTIQTRVRPTGFRHQRREPGEWPGSCEPVVLLPSPFR
jgi:hypothetical protein